MAGAQVYAPTLTGLAERSHLLRDDINLNTHIDDVVGEMKWKDLSNVVLVGHSYAGMVITGVAEREAGRLSSIVYLDAFLPESDQSLRDITGTKSAPTNGPMTAIPAVQMVNAKDAPWVQSKLTPQPGGTFSQAVKSTGAIYSLPKRTYIQALIGASPWFTKAYQKCAEEPRWQTHQLNCLHDAMLDLPDELTAMLLTTV
jgi:pimeloyl-ACP methyl ester carboxylesterase